MYKVMVVEDERLLRLALKSTVDWEQSGFLYAGEASNGAEALEILPEIRPDLVITDIKMPKMDGITMAKEIRKQFPDLKIIFLTCYEEVEYLKAAISIKASDYLMKMNIQPEDLSQVLCRVKAELDSLQIEEDKINNLLSEVEYNRKLAIEKLLTQHIRQELPQEVFLSECGNLGICWTGKGFYLILISIDDFSILEESLKKSERTNLERALISTVENAVLKGEPVIKFTWNRGMAVVILGFPHHLPYREAAEIPLKFSNRILQMWSGYSKYAISFGVSNRNNDLIDLPQAFQEAATALENRFFNWEERIHLLNPDCPDVRTRIPLKNPPLDEFLTVLRQGPFEKIKGFCEDLFDDIKQTSDRQLIYGVFNQLFFSIHQMTQLINSDFNQQIMKDYLKLQSRLNQVNTGPVFCQLVADYLGKVYGFWRNNPELTVHNPLIQKALLYIHQHLAEDINQQNVAEYLAVSPNYLSQIFGKLTGYRFSDYINRQRVERAKQLLLTTDLKITLIAQEVGLADVKYFFRIFKKNTGLTPRDYRKTMGEKV